MSLLLPSLPAGVQWSLVPTSSIARRWPRRASPLPPTTSLLPLAKGAWKLQILLQVHARLAASESLCLTFEHPLIARRVRDQLKPMVEIRRLAVRVRLRGASLYLSRREAAQAAGVAA
jgi:hypothetical protein